MAGDSVSLLSLTNLIGHNCHAYYFHARGLSVNNCVRKNIVRDLQVREF